MQIAHRCNGGFGVACRTGTRGALWQDWDWDDGLCPMLPDRSHGPASLVHLQENDGIYHAHLAFP